jgi:predicted RNA polymerase sigma factor
MLLTEARRAARVPASGELVALNEQDRGAWLMRRWQPAVAHLGVRHPVT